MSGLNIKHSKENIEWAEEVVKQNEVVNKDSQFAIDLLLGENPDSEISLAIARLVLQESKK